MGEFKIMRIFRIAAYLPFAAVVLLIGVGNANAALVHYEITGDVSFGSGNAFGLVNGDTITATGVFDDSALAGGNGTVSFASGSGNTMTINAGTQTLIADNDSRFATDSKPSLTFSSFSLTDFDFIANAGTNGAPADFNSNFLSFDDFDQLLGQWESTVSLNPVPIPGAIWLLGSALAGLMGTVRKRKAA